MAQKTDKKGIGIILHSGSRDRITHGLSIALAALALGRDVRLFFSYWALTHLRKDAGKALGLHNEANPQRKAFDKAVDEGHILSIGELLAEVKKMGGKVYACTNSMSILNIARDELISEVDKSMGITTFLTEVSEHQILYI